SFLTCLVFSFSCDGARRGLHSFPTRRSSDLRRLPTFMPRCWKPSRSRRRRRPAASPFRSISAPPWPVGRRCSSRRPVSSSRRTRSEEHTSELQSRENLVCRLLLEKKKKQNKL